MVTQAVSPFPEVLPFETLPVIREQIGSQRKFVFRFRSPWDTWQDQNIGDYAYWDKARRGKAEGLKLAGLFLRPLSSKITAWVLGDAPLWITESKTATHELNQWWRNWQSSFMRAYQEALDLGDCYAVFNGDGTITVVPPHVVDRILDDDDLQTLIGYRVTITYSKDDGVDAQTFIDEYYADYRVRTVKNFQGSTIRGYPKEYTNPLGKIPVVHIPNRFGADEVFGRPLGDPFLNLLIRYDDVFDAALKGNIRQGRPTPTINKMGTATQVDEFWSRYGTTETVTRPDGTQEEVTVIHFDPDMLLTLGGEAQFKYEAPGSFVGDTEKLLGLLFYLVVQHSEVAEFAMGVAVASTKASTESQLEPFLRYIKKMRGLALNWIQELADLFLSYLGLFEREARGQQARILWKPMSAAEARLVLDSDIWMFAKKLVDPLVATWLAPVGFTDPEMVQELAQQYWGQEYATPAAAATTPESVPASGGGDQQDFKPEDQLQPTERMMEIPVLEVVGKIKQNGHRIEPIPI